MLREMQASPFWYFSSQYLCVCCVGGVEGWQDVTFAKKAAQVSRKWMCVVMAGVPFLGTFHNPVGSLDHSFKNIATTDPTNWN